jgi:hypothetical protein
VQARIGLSLKKGDAARALGSSEAARADNQHEFSRSPVLRYGPAVQTFPLDR